MVTDKRELPDLLGRFGVTDVPTGISGFGRRQRAYVKVQDGCMLRCSFCIIPHVRPQLASRPLEHILDEVRRLVDHGYREVVLTGIHLGHYGVEWNRRTCRKEDNGCGCRTWCGGSPSCPAISACGFRASRPRKSRAS